MAAQWLFLLCLHLPPLFAAGYQTTECLRLMTHESNDALGIFPIVTCTCIKHHGRNYETDVGGHRPGQSTYTQKQLHLERQLHFINLHTNFAIPRFDFDTASPLHRDRLSR